MALPSGLGAGTAGAFGELIAGVVGKSCAIVPWLAPALLFADKTAQGRIGMPVADKASVLVHDFQAITWLNPLPFDMPITASAQAVTKGQTFTYHFDLAVQGRVAVTLDTALRLVPRSDLAALRPTQFRTPQMTGDLGGTLGHSFTQAQVDRYLALSGDENPVHSDPAMAAALGLSAPIVPGLLLAATLQPSCEAALPGARLRSLKIRFMAPLAVSETFGLAVHSRTAPDPESTRIRVCLFASDARALAIADLAFSTDLIA